jgi:hypothetical protein
MGCLETVASEYPQEVIWTIAFDGKNVGQVTSRAPKKFEFYADIGLERVTSAEPVPSVGERSEKYAGFAGGKVYRPLVAVSESNFADPEKWKPAKLPDEVIAGLRKEFRKKFPNVSNCKNPEENVEKPWQFRDEDIVIGKAYGSQTRWFMAGMSLGDWRCDGPQDDGGAFDVQWYVVEPSGAIRFLDAGLWLVDAGDYDNDGNSELLFTVGRYNVGGYELFYDKFKKKVSFLFAYN